VVIVPSGSRSYSNRIVWFPPARPKYVGTIGGPATPAPASVVEDGIDFGERSQRGPVIIPAIFDEGDPVGPRRVEVFVNGEMALEQTVEVVHQ